MLDAGSVACLSRMRRIDAARQRTMVCDGGWHRRTEVLYCITIRSLLLPAYFMPRMRCTLADTETYNRKTFFDTASARLNFLPFDFGLNLCAYVRVYKGC